MSIPWLWVAFAVALAIEFVDALFREFVDLIRWSVRRFA